MERKEAIIRWLKSFDYLLALLVIALSAFGVVMIYVSTNHEAVPISIQMGMGHLWELQRVHVITGVFVLILFACIDYRFIGRFYLVIYGIVMALLLALAIMGEDPNTGTARWLPVPVPGFATPFSIQPSEFAKIFMIIFLAKLLEVKNEAFNRIGWLSVVLLSIAVPVVFVFLQPSLSAALVILFASLVVLFAAGLKLRHIIVGIVIIVPIVVFLWLELQREDPLILYRIFEPYQVRRVRTMLYPEGNPDGAWQVGHSIRAVAAGGLTGRGFMNNQVHVAVGHNDFIFAIIAEQFGFVGSAILLGVVLAVIVKCILIALRAVDMQGRLIAAGVAGMLLFETFVNVGVAADFLPTTGMPFPFVSYGGSMIWVHMMAIGMVINVGLNRDHEEEEEY